MLALRPRESNGRLRRRLARDEETQVARIASQPHRRGERTNIAASPWQRALKAGLIRNPSGRFTAAELEAAGLRFCEARANYSKACGSRLAYAVDSGGMGGDIPKALRKRWLDGWSDILAVLRKHGRWALQAAMVAEEAHPEAEERLWDDAFCHALGRALAALATHFKTGAPISPR